MKCHVMEKKRSQLLNGIRAKSFTRTKHSISFRRHKNNGNNLHGFIIVLTS